MDFQPVIGSHISRATAVLLGNTFQNLLREGPLTQKTVVDDARPCTSPTHPLFEWNNAIAGEKFRLDQAGYYLRSVDILIPAESEEPLRIRAVHCEGEKGYDFTTRILKNPNRRKDLLAKALAEFHQWKARWETLEELGEIFAAAKKVKPLK